LVKWFKTYFEENKEALKVLDINSPDELRSRILEVSKQHR
jgi:hypothetical protein